MTKISYEERINLYYDRKNGMSFTSLNSKYGINKSGVEYLVRLIDKHGFDILRTNENKSYSSKEKERILNRILINNESILSVSIDEGLIAKGMLNNWLKKYRENGYNIVERKRGRPTMKIELKPKKNETIEEENERLKKENLYLKVELEYSKKLRAVVQARKNQQQKGGGMCFARCRVPRGLSPTAARSRISTFFLPSSRHWAFPSKATGLASVTMSFQRPSFLLPIIERHFKNVLSRSPTYEGLWFPAQDPKP